MAGPEAGLALVEVLFAAQVLVTGLLGLASLKAASTQIEHERLLHGQASGLAHEIIDLMRANLPSALGGRYDIVSCHGLTPGDQLAGDDLRHWCDRVTATLPAGDGAVAVAADGSAQVAVRWHRRPPAAAQTPRNARPGAELKLDAQL